MQPNLFDILLDAAADPPAQQHSETSIAAAESVKPMAATMRRKVFEYIQSRGDDGATDLEIEEATGFPGSTVRPRRVELDRAGLIRPCGKTRLTRSKRQAAVWVAVIKEMSK